MFRTFQQCVAPAMIAQDKEQGVFITTESYGYGYSLARSVITTESYGYG